MIEQRHYERVMAHADRNEPTGCLVSRYSVGSHGYAQAWDGETVVLAHRLVWEFVNGPIPDGFTVDHRQGLCLRKCIEVGHLRLLENFDNARRQQGHDWPLGQCHRGHPDSMLVLRKRGPKNGGGQRLRCIACEREDQRAYRARRAARA